MVSISWTICTARGKNVAYHDAGDGRRDPSVEELEGVVGDLLRGGPVLALSTRGDHTGLEEDALEHHIVLSHVVEGLSPHLLCDLEGPLDAVLTVKKDFRLHNWHQTVFLADPEIRRLYTCILKGSQCLLLLRVSGC